MSSPKSLDKKTLDLTDLADASGGCFPGCPTLAWNDHSAPAYPYQMPQAAQPGYGYGYPGYQPQPYAGGYGAYGGYANVWSVSGPAWGGRRGW